ncbi:MAG: hypothetical protein J3K34DRAFT_514681 [Monoraphidium minutum]|nr:MAG: hypothetical protein J3K34DRAFT_514681 [Monoraphidium minutum]
MSPHQPPSVDMDAVVASSSSLMSHSTSNVDAGGDGRRIRLRLAFGGSFVAAADGSYRYAGGEYYNESVSADARYADFMYKLGEKFKTAVSVKYQCPGEDMDPGALITVADDDDLAELKEEYFAHLLRPGTPSKTFRIRCFAFAASEEPLTPDEILEGQVFFNHEAIAAAAAGGPGGGGSGGGASAAAAAAYDSALEQQVLLHSLLPRSGSGGGALSPAGGGGRAPLFASWAGPAGPGGGASASAEMERTALERMRMSVNNLSDFHASAAGIAAAAAAWRAAGGGLVADLPPGGGGGGGGGCDDEELEDAEYDAADEAEAAVAAYWEAEQAALRRAASGVPAPAPVAVGGGGSGSGGGGEPGSARAAQLPADPFDQEGSLSDAPTGEAEAGAAGGDEAEAEADEAEALQAAMQEPGGGAGAAAAWGPLGADGGAPLGGANLPSYISAFGDAADGDEGGDAAGGGSGGGGGGGSGAGSGGGRSSRRTGGGGADAGGTGTGGGGYVPRTQDSGFSLEGERIFGGPDGGGGAAAAGWAGDGPPPERADSGDSLQSLPKLQPVHRLTRGEVKVLAKIGEGAFGEVSRAQAPLYGTVAVKWLKTERFSKHSASFWREAALLADLNHPNVLRFYGVITDAPGGGGSAGAASASAAGGGGGSASSGGEPGAVVGIMTEYVRGGSLAQFLRAGRAPLPLRLRCELALQAANGLAYLHELRIVHFDLKPDNLLLDGPAALVLAAAQAHAAGGERGGGGGPLSLLPAEPLLEVAAAIAGHPHGAAHKRGASAASGAAGGGTGSEAALAQAVVAGWVPTVKALETRTPAVADFGLSKHKLNSYVSSCRDLRGTLPYMAPELVADPERVSEKADVWSMGVVMWEMLMREMPYQDLTPQQILMGLMCGNLHLDVPSWCDAEWRGLLEACLEPNPANRPSMKELARQLEAIRDQQAAAHAAADAAAAEAEAEAAASRRASSSGVGPALGGAAAASAPCAAAATAAAAVATAAAHEAVSAAGAAAAHMQQHHHQQLMQQQPAQHY